MGKTKADKPSSGLPPSIAPATNTQPAQSSPPAMSPNIPFESPISNNTPMSATSLTSKQWIVPPRPKPGRKPATDTPPTKRKAQNRAAQRAFRERRAARVGELEEELKKIEKEDEEEQNGLRAQIETQEKDIDELKTSVTFWMQRCRGLESELAIESAAKEQVLQSMKDVSASTVSPVPDVPPLQLESMEPESMGCGNCSSINNCSCIQEVINMSNPDPDYDEADFSTAKRAHSPSSRPSNSKRAKPDLSNELETDFTSTFSTRQMSNDNGPSSASPSAVPDPCGFCTDGTACICAEMQAEAEANAANNRHQDYHQHIQTSRPPSSSQTRSRISELSHITPPPSDTDVSIYLPPIKTTPPSNSCINGPGTCLQCRSDPQSTLFCKSLARSREQTQSQSQQSSSSTCCGGNTNGSACCQNIQLPSSSHSSSRRNNAPRQDPNTITIPPLTLTCADAFTTLSRHPGYERAMGTNEMNRWLPKLHPHLTPSRTPPLPSPSSAGPTTDTNNLNNFQRPPASHRSQRPASTARRNTVASHGNGNIYDDVNQDIVARSPSPSQHPRSRPRPQLKTMENRPAMEIDAANVMAVLREFDRRFAD